MPSSINNSYYRPACTLRLQIRLEENAVGDSADTQSESEPFKPQATHLLAQERRQVSKLSQLRLGGNSAEIGKAQRDLASTRAQIDKTKTAAAPSGAPLGVGDVYSIDFFIAPTKMDCELNTFRSVDTLSFEVPFRDIPLESKIIRSCLIELYLGTVPEGVDAARLPRDRSTIMFRGFVDKWRTSHSDEEARVSATARSLECILYDQKIHPLSPLYRINGAEEKISSYINRILAAIPATSGRLGGDQLKAVYYRADTAAEPVLSRKVLLKALQSAKSQKAAGAPTNQPTVQADPDNEEDDAEIAPGFGQPRAAPPMQEMRAWDLIVQACSLAGGLVASYDPSVSIDGVEGDFILIRPPQTIYETVDGLAVRGGPPDGFSRSLPDPNSPLTKKKSEIRFVVWGSNISRAETERQLGRVKVPAVEIRSYNSDAPPGKRLLTVRYPPVGSGGVDKISKGKRTTSVGPTGESKTEEVYLKYMSGVRDLAQMQQYAVALYHAIGRNELSVTIETDSMNSYFDPQDPDIATQNINDILKVRYGSPVKVLVARQTREGSVAGVTQVVTSPLSELFERRGAELERFLLEQQGRFSPQADPQIRQQAVKQMVQRITTAITAARGEDLFYCRSAKHSWDADEGWSCSLELVNFTTIRNDPKNLGPTAIELNDKLKPKKPVSLGDKVKIRGGRIQRGD